MAELVRGDIDILPPLPYSEASELKENPNMAVSARPGLSSASFTMQTRGRLLSNAKQAPLVPLFSTITASAGGKNAAGFASSASGAPLLREVRKD